MTIQNIIRPVLKNPRAISAVNMILGACVLLSALMLAGSLLSEKSSRTIAVSDREKKAAAAQPKRLGDYESILKNNPFGFQAGELKPLSSAQETAGQAAAVSDVTLIGAVSGRSEDSYAIFSDSSGRQDVFRVGQQVYGLGTLSAVLRNRVVVLSRGSETEIPLSEIVVIKEQDGPARPSGFGIKTGEATYLLDQRRVLQAVEKPDQILTDARFLPNMVQGRQQGFVLRELKPGGIFQSLGLHNGDILLRINEHEISSPEAALQALMALKGIDRAQLDIMRNGARMSLNYQMR